MFTFQATLSRKNFTINRPRCYIQFARFHQGAARLLGHENQLRDNRTLAELKYMLLKDSALISSWNFKKSYLY